MKQIQILIVAVLLTLISSCQERKETKKDTDKLSMQDPLNNMKTSFKWQEGLSCPEGYPIQVYRGWLEGPLVSNGVNEKPNSSTSISGFGTTTGIGDWGENSSGMSQGEKPIPQRLNCTWYSYVEDVMYDINTELDYPKMVKLFNEGFQDSNRKRGKVMTTYNHITVGFAPGGVVVVWLQGGGQKIVEIGRYQGEKTTISPKEIASLDSHERLLFDPVDRARTLSNPKIIAPEVHEANKNKPIPYGLWDSYRIKYNWRPVLVFVGEGKIQEELGLYMFNAESETLFDEEFTKNEYQHRAVPKGFVIGYWDKMKQGYGGGIDFDEKEIFLAFKELYKKNPEAKIDLEIKITPGSSYLGATLKNGIETIPLKKGKIKVFESRMVTREYKFNWRPVFVFSKGEKMPNKIFFSTETFGQFLSEKEFTNMPFQQNGTPYKISFDYNKEDGNTSSVEFIFEEDKKIIEIFKEIDQLKPGAPIEMEIKISKGYESFIITLKGNGKEIPVKFTLYKN